MGEFQTDESLQDTARRVGVLTEYQDHAGNRVEVTAEALRAVLAVVDEPASAVKSAYRPAEGAHLTPLDGRAWGWHLQLYQIRSDSSWGIGDLSDLHDLAIGMAQQGADVVLVNPLHAISPAEPMQPSPYYPSSRRFSDQLSVSVMGLLEYQHGSPELRAKVDALRPPDGPLIDRSQVWAAKRAAFELLMPDQVDASGEPDSAQLQGFAVFCALAEQFGRDWTTWPEELRRPGPTADAAADPHRIALHTWIQLAARGQLLNAQNSARDAGMRIGIMHDLAVGIDPKGADAWLLQDTLAPGMSVGAPPDRLNLKGQNWGLPAVRPDRLAAADYEPWKDVVRAACRFGGGLRIDHVMGLYRLWWIPEELGATNGAYVCGDWQAMLGVVIEIAAEHGTVVIGEDLGTVDPEFQEAMRSAGVLGTSVLWFEQDPWAEPMPSGTKRIRWPEHWRPDAVATVTTHDLPTARGYLRAAHIYARDKVGMLVDSLDTELDRAASEREALLGMLHDVGLIGSHTDEDGVIEAMHAALGASQSKLVLAGVADAVGDLRQPNMPGTQDEYPNWRLPLTDITGAEIGVAGFLAAPGTARIAAVLTEAIRPSG